MPLRPYLDTFPIVAANAFVDETAVLIGDVQIGEESSVWIYAVLRGDVNRIQIGKRTSIQDMSMLHVTHKSEKNPTGSPLIIGDDVTVGHHVMLHGCTIGNRVLVGMDSTILDDAVIEDDVIIGAGSLVPPRKRLESGHLYLGSPVQKIRPLTDAEREHLLYSSANYVRWSNEYLQMQKLDPA